MSAKRTALGKGLSALLESADTDITSKKIGDVTVAGSVTNIAISEIEANPFQPRTEFEKDSLIELANSIREQGIIQPITVRKLGYDKYQIISGERRFRASQLAGLTHIPAYIRIANDVAMLEMALVENIQRENLNPLEIAISYKRLVEECSITQEELSTRVGKDRTTVTNYLRLLKLPAEIQKGLKANQVTMGHARALLGIEHEETQLKVYREIVKNELSVRAIEEIAKEKKGKKRTKVKTLLSPEQEKFVEELRGHFGKNISLKKDIRGKGKLTISFTSENELQKIIDLFGF